MKTQDFVLSSHINLTETQKQVINDIHGNLFIQAVPGAGKTTTLLEKIIRLHINKPKSRILYLSFNVRLITEMKQKLKDFYQIQDLTKNEYITLATFHRILYKIYIRIFPKAILNTTISKKIENSANNPNTIRKYTNHLNMHTNYSQMVTFEDIEDFFIKNPSLFLEYFKKIDYIFIDEVQDLKENLVKLVQILFTKGNHIINAVGDLNQTIYQFAGVDINTITKFKTLFKKYIFLSETHRLTSPTTDLVNTIFAKVNQHKIKPMNLKMHSTIYIIGLNSNLDQYRFLRLLLQKWNIMQTSIAEDTIQKQHKLIPFSLKGKTLSILLRSNNQVSALYKKLSRSNLPLVKIPSFLNSEIKYLEKLKNWLRLNINNHNIQINDFKQIAYNCQETRLPETIISEISNIDSWQAASFWTYQIEQYFRNLPNTGAINISTIHQAKGLEFSTTIIPFFDQFEPWNISTNPELKNLIYVSLTRHTQELVLLYNSQNDKITTFLKGVVNKVLNKNQQLGKYILHIKNIALKLPKQQTLF